MKTKFLTVICAIILVGLQSCSCKKGAEAVAELSTGSWELEQMHGESIDPGEFAKIPALNFDKAESRISGNSGCNSMSGSYTINEDKITFGPIAQTKMACQGAGEGKFMTLFNSVQKFKLQGDKLNLYDGNGSKVLCFKKK